MIARYLMMLALFGFIVWVCLSDPPTKPTPRRSYYCEMVDIHKAGVSIGDPGLGWPDYKGIYEPECKRVEDTK